MFFFVYLFTLKELLFKKNNAWLMFLFRFFVSDIKKIITIIYKKKTDNVYFMFLLIYLFIYLHNNHYYLKEKKMITPT